MSIMGTYEGDRNYYFIPNPSTRVIFKSRDRLGRSGIMDMFQGEYSELSCLESWCRQ